MIDEYSRKCLAIKVARRLKADDVLEVLSELFITEGMPHYIQSDNGSEFTATTLKEWLKGTRNHFDSSWCSLHLPFNLKPA